MDTLDIDLLDFQTYLDIEDNIQSLLDDIAEGKETEVSENELDKLFDLRSKFEENFLLFFEMLIDAPDEILKVRGKLIDIRSNEDGGLDKDNPDTYLKYETYIDEEEFKGMSWRYGIGDTVTVGETMSTFHPFEEDDIVEILTLEGGDHAYQYYARYIDNRDGTYLINDEELI